MSTGFLTKLSRHVGLNTSPKEIEPLFLLEVPHDESYIPVLATAAEVLQALDTLLDSNDIYKLPEQQDTLSRLKAARRKAASGYYNVVADALTQAPAWNNLFESYFTVVAAAKVHHNKLSTLRGLFTGAKQVQDENVMLDLILDLSFLSTEMPKDFCAWYLEQGANLLHDWWAGALQDVSQSKFQGDLQVLQKLAVESSICFPNLAWCQSAAGELAELLKSKSGQEKLHNFLKACAELNEGLEDGEEQLLLNLKEHAGRAKGMPLENEDGTTMVKLLFNKVVEHMAGQSKSPQTLQSLLDILVLLAPWMETSMGNTIDLIKAFMGLQKNLEKFKEKGFKTTNPILPIMEELMRAKKQVEELNKASALPAWQIEPWKGLVEIAGKYVQDVSNYLLGEAKTKLREALSRAKVLASGIGEAKAWQEGINATTTWDAVMARHDTTLGKLRGNDLDEAEVTLSKVSWVERGCSNRNTNVCEFEHTLTEKIYWVAPLRGL